MSEPASIELGSTSRAGDAGYLAAADVAAIAAELDIDYRLIGGNAVSLLAAVHGVTDLVPGRETADADFAAGYQVVADPGSSRRSARAATPPWPGTGSSAFTPSQNPVC
jgi:hypothetical protein